MKKIRAKKQFRLFDVYRYVATGEMSNVEGIVSYVCNNDASVLVVRFVDYTCTYTDGIPVNYITHNEQELKEVITIINKRLANCATPGPRKCGYKAYGKHRKL